MIYKRVRKKDRRIKISVGVHGTNSCVFIGVEAYAQYGFVCAVTRASFAGFSRWRIHVVENGNESMPLGQWSSFLRSPYFFQLLIQIDRTSLFCTMDALAPDTNRYLFGFSPHFPSGTSLVRFRFHFHFLPSLIRLILPRNDSLVSKDARILSTCRNHGPMRKIEI